MKKIFIMAAVSAAITFASCGNSQKQDSDNTDSVVVANSAVEAISTEIESALKDMAAQLDVKDASKFNEALVQTQEKIQELITTDPEAAKDYLQQMQDYLKANADKIEEVAGTETAAATSAITNVSASQLIETVKSQIDSETSTVGSNAISKAAEAVSTVKNAPTEAKEAASQAVEQGKSTVESKVQETVESAKQKTDDAIESSKQKANDAVNNSVSNVKSKLGL